MVGAISRSELRPAGVVASGNVFGFGAKGSQNPIAFLAGAIGAAALLVPTSVAGQVQFGHRDRVERIEAGLVVRDEPATHGIHDRMGFYNVPGVTVAVADAGNIVWARAYGVKRAGGGEPVSTETLFQAASISKPIAALGVLELVEQGRLDLDRNVNDYLTSWNVPENDFTEDAPVTLRGILSHSAGLTVHGFPGYELGDRIPTAPQVLDGTGPANTGPVRVDVEPGTLWRYSGGGYTVLQQLLEDVTGQPFDEFMKQTVLDRLGLLHSTYAQPLPPDRWDEAASAHDASGEPMEGGWHVYPEMAAAGLWTTPFELLRVALDLQDAVGGSVGRFLEPATAKEMVTPVSGEYGLGFSVMEGRNARFAHGGSNAGFKAHFLATFEGGKAVVVMTNGDRGAELAQEIIRAVMVEYQWPEIGGQ